jgi:hypothetical protein
MIEHATHEVVVVPEVSVAPAPAQPVLAAAS